MVAARRNVVIKIFVTFDLLLFMEAGNITFSYSSDSILKSVVVRLGGFHLVMSFVGSVDYVISKSVFFA